MLLSPPFPVTGRLLRKRGLMLCPHPEPSPWRCMHYPTCEAFIAENMVARSVMAVPPATRAWHLAASGQPDVWISIMTTRNSESALPVCLCMCDARPAQPIPASMAGRACECPVVQGPPCMMTPTHSHPTPSTPPAKHGSGDRLTAGHQDVTRCPGPPCRLGISSTPAWRSTMRTPALPSPSSSRVGPASPRSLRMADGG